MPRHVTPHAAIVVYTVHSHILPCPDRHAQVDLHYNGFCNSVLWQLFHYVPLNTDTKLSETRTLQFQWNAYQDANRHAPDNISIFANLQDDI